MPTKKHFSLYADKYKTPSYKKKFINFWLIHIYIDMPTKNNFSLYADKYKNPSYKYFFSLTVDK